MSQYCLASVSLISTLLDQTQAFSMQRLMLWGQTHDFDYSTMFLYVLRYLQWTHFKCRLSRSNAHLERETLPVSQACDQVGEALQ